MNEITLKGKMHCSKRNYNIYVFFSFISFIGMIGKTSSHASLVILLIFHLCFLDQNARKLRSHTKSFSPSHLNHIYIML